MKVSDVKNVKLSKNFIFQKSRLWFRTTTSFEPRYHSCQRGGVDGAQPRTVTSIPADMTERKNAQVVDEARSVTIRSTTFFRAAAFETDAPASGVVRQYKQGWLAPPQDPPQSW